MLGSIRKFSKTFMAKIFIAIIALPFILWGMGDIFSSGKQNIIAEINDETISSKEFISYIQKIELSKEQVENFGKSQILENILSNYLSEKIIEIESKKKGIILTDKALKNIIISDKSFQKDKKYLRVEYEKFLIKNGYSAPTYEKYIKGLEIKAQLLNLYSGGIKLPKFIIEDLFNKDNHLKKINYLNLSSIYSKKVISEQEIEKFYNENKELFKEKFISFKYIELTPEILTKNKNYNDLFYEKIDLIENQILDGKKFDEIINELLFQKKLMINTNGAMELLSTWDLHVQSWLNYNTVPRLIIKYEDLKSNPKENIINIKEFLNKIHKLNIDLSDQQIDKIIENTNFNNLKKLENQNGFDEASKHSKFFRSGNSNQWKDILSKTQIQLIENNLKTLMRHFNYI